MSATPTRRRRGRDKQLAQDAPLTRQHIALIGFMGAGKSSVGRALAARAGCDFVDLDDVIAEVAGLSIPEIFRQHGEVGFRARERAALRETLAIDHALVIATGGGTFADSSMRQWLQGAAHTVYLEASVDSLLARIGQGPQREQRPMLSGPDRSATVERLLEERRPGYEECEITIRTDGEKPEDVAGAILDALRLTDALLEERKGDGAVTVNAASGSYEIRLRPDAGPWLVDSIRELSGRSRLCVITDDDVAPLHAAPLAQALRAAGADVHVLSFVAGESSKTLGTASKLYEELQNIGLTRSDMIVAAGGGVVGDIAGFVASTFLRGVPLIQVPTTTLAAVDSSVGGKTAVNTTRGKNLIGTFYAPRGVLVAVEHLATQDRRAHAAGLVEALKMAATMDETLFATIVDQADRLLRFEPSDLLGVITRAVEIKAQVVSRDEREAGERAVLNYGHTIGHAIEMGESFQIPHGEAVGLGMIAESEWAESRGASPTVRRMLTAGLRALGMPVEWRDAKLSIEALSADKKRTGSAVRMPVLARVGAYTFEMIEMGSLVSFLRVGE